MKIQAKHILWGAGGIAAIGVAVLVLANSKTIRIKLFHLKKQGEDWIRPVLGKITSPFGTRVHPTTGKEHFHNGIDLAVPVGTSIKSPMEGTVEDVFYSKTGGNTVLIRHKNNFQTGYAHLSKALVRKGEKVKAGEAIALSGNTGRSTGPHVHLTLTDPAGQKVGPGKTIYASVV